MNHGGPNKDSQQDSSPPEENLHGLEKSSKFFLTLPYLCQSKKDKFKNKVAERDGLAGDTEVLHSSSRIKTKFRRRKVPTRGVQYQYQVDLVDYSKLKRDNSGYTFVLSIIDSFSRLAFAIPIKRKTGKEVAASLRRAFNHMGNPKSCTQIKEKSFIIGT